MFGKITTFVKDIMRSRRPVFGPALLTDEDRHLAQTHLRYHDHGILRGRWTNLKEISPGVWRSNQPDPERLAVHAHDGIKTILSLRGDGNSGHYLLEKEACAAHGIPLISIGLSARKAAPKADYLALLNQFEVLPRPFLFHCKSGADRTGLASAFYLLHIDQAPLDVAREQLGLKYLHVKWSATGILDAILDAYGAHLEAHGPTPLRDWITDHYDADAITQKFRG